MIYVFIVQIAPTRDYLISNLEQRETSKSNAQNVNQLFSYSYIL